MKPVYKVVLAALIVLCLTPLASPAKPAAAHPMGNFTINQYSALTVAEDRVDIRYILDMAEIPAHQELGTIREDRSTDLNQAELDAYTSRKGPELARGLTLALNGKSVEMKLVGKPSLTFPPGVGGLPTLRLEMSLVAPIEGVESGTLQYRSTNYSERIGWKEIIARPEPGVTISNSTVPTTDLSDELRQYPVDLLNNPPRASSASLSFTTTARGTGAGSNGATGTSGASGAIEPQGVQGGAAQDNGWGSLAWVRQQTDSITALLKERDLPLGALFVALAIAFAIGAAHALSPGHGKTVVAAYLVGSRGTALHAIFLGLTVTLSHTIGVFLLGFVVLYLADYILPEALYPWLTFISGSLLVLMGVSLFAQRWRAWKRDGSPFSRLVQMTGNEKRTTNRVDSHHSHDSHADHQHLHSLHGHDGLGESHAHEHHDNTHRHIHDHEHGHEDAGVPHKHGPFGRPHTHLPAEGQKATIGNLLVLGITGGIIPCPSALVVLLVAIASGQVALGLLLILAFSFGLAAVLMAIGLLMVYSRNMLQRFRLGGNARLSWLLVRLPILSALAVSCLGLLIALQAFRAG